MSQQRLLPIKVVFPSQIDYQAPGPGFGKLTFFGQCTDKLRKHFEAQAEAVRKYFDASFNTWGDLPAIAKVSIKPEALAKSHRPDDLFNANTCPIVGANRLGELFVSVSRTGLEHLSRSIREGRSQAIQANLTTIKNIEPYTADDAIGMTVDELASEAAKKSSPGLRYRLFRHPSEAINKKIEAAVRQLAGKLGVAELQSMDYGPDLRVFRVRAPSKAAVQALAGFIGTQSLSPFPGYRVVRSAARVIGDMTEVHLPPPEQGIDYPVVGIIDSGTDAGNPYLQAWIADRFDFVPRSEQNNNHGSFVAAILAGGRILNNNDQRFPNAPCKIVDVVALDKDGGANELDLLTPLTKQLHDFPTFGYGTFRWEATILAVMMNFQTLASALDDRMRRHNVTFVVAAGNYAQRPFLGWRLPDGSVGEHDRICAPADSVRAIMWVRAPTSKLPAVA